MKKNSVVTNYLFTVIYQIFAMLTPIITSPFLARTLGAESLGINTYTYSIVYWFILFGMLGISLYGNKEISKCVENREKLSERFWRIFLFQIMNLIIALIIYYFLISFFKPQYFSAFLLQGLMILTSCFDISWFYNGIENFKKISIRNFFTKILTIICIFLIIRNPSQVYIYICISVLMNAFSNSVMWIGLKKYIDFKKPKFKDIISQYKDTIVLFLPQIATTLYTVFDQTMIGLLYSKVDEVTYYNQAHRFINMFLFIITSIGTVMLPRIVKKRGNGDDTEINKLANKVFKVAIFISIPMAFGISSIALYFIPWFYPSSFYKVGYLMCMLSPILIFISATNVMGVQYLIALDKNKIYTISVVLGCLANLILNYVLIPQYGAYGAVIASVVTEAFVFVCQYISIKNIFNFEGVFTKFLKYIIESVIMGLAVFVVGNQLGSSFFVNIIQLVVGFSVYVIINIITKDDIFYFCFDKISGLVKLRK